MNRENLATRKGIKTIFSRGKEMIFLLVLGCILLTATYSVFHKKDATTASISMSSAEEKTAQILQEIQGVGDASVMVCETEDGAKSVVVVCEGANDLRVVMNVRQAVSAALNVEEKSVKIFLKK